METEEPSRQESRSRDRTRALDDAALPIISAILTVVPASRWAFARINTDGKAEQLLSFGAHDGLEELFTEFKRQRARSNGGPRIAATLGPVGDAESSITILFADERATFGILTLARTSELGCFTSNEISMLTLAIGTTTDHLSLLRRLQPSDPMPVHNSMRERPGPIGHADSACYVLDYELRVVLTLGVDNRRSVDSTGVRGVIADRLPHLLERTVQKLTATWNEPGDECISREARPVPFLIVRALPVTGPLGSFIGVRIERLHAPNSLRDAAARFNISMREVQVLELLLDGKHLNEIGATLYIASSTVQDHIRSMIDKTGSRNRSDLISRILGWEFAAETE
jgi:DNA-binding CsgD family transcriptional regulator